MTDMPWTYERRPDTRTTNVRVGIWLFLASEAMFFGSLFSAYVLLRAGATSWPNSRDFVGIENALVNTAALAAASLLVSRSNARTWLSSVLAVGFLIGKCAEYIAKLDAGLHPSANMFLACWFTLTFIHALHVAGGVAANVWLIAGTRRLAAPHLLERLHALRLYWLFIDLVWIAILVSFYFI